MGRRAITWQQWELDLLIQEFPDNYTYHIANRLNRKYASVATKAYNMGLKKSAAFKAMESVKQGERLKIVGEKNRLKKGNVPHNKGKKMPDEAKRKMMATMFKPKHLPHNTKYDGHERIDKEGYTWIRVKKGKFRLKHRLIWEQANGKIPPNMVIIFKDRNSQHITLENLEMITTKENMLRNAIHRFPKELITVIRLNQKLKNKINATQQN